MRPFPSRRKFLATGVGGCSAIAMAAASYARVVGANDRIAIGLIGCGDRAHREHVPNIAKHAKAANVEIVAGCDPWRIARERSAQEIRDAFGVKPAIYETYEELLSADGIDAVIITSCDHQHARQLIAAVQNGKDVYCEKPIARTNDELNRIYDAVQETRKVVQVGTQLRSLPSVMGCRAVYQTGILGKVTLIEQRRNGVQPYWYYYLRDLKREDVNWSEFVFGSSKRAFDAAAFSAWMGYRDFSDGPLTQLAVHFLDTLHFITGSQLPESCVAADGLFEPKDQYRFDAPDQVHAVWTYPDGFMVTYSTNFGSADDSTIKFIGDDAVLDLTDLMAPKLAVKGKSAEAVQPAPCADHWLDWLRCLRTRSAPNASIEAGYNQTVACLMAVQACRTGRRIVFDKERRLLQEG